MMACAAQQLVGVSVVTLLISCVLSSEVVPIGNGRYMISGRANGGLHAGKE